jgi:hypothetical protein
MGAGAVGQLSDPFVDSDADGVARLFADPLSQRRLDREHVHAIALGHQRGREWLAVDRAADLHEPAGTESSATSSISTHVHAPGLSPF